MMLDARNKSLIKKNDKVIGKGTILNIFDLKLGKSGND
jgi:hypothetical protein